MAPITNMGFAMPVSEAIQLRRHAANSLSRLEDDITRQQATIASLAASGHVTRDAATHLEAMLAECRYFKKLRDRRSPDI